MNIPKINGFYKNKITKTIGMFFLLSLPVVSVKQCVEDSIDEAKTEIFYTDLLRYRRIMNETKDLNILSKNKYWKNEVKLMNDSIDSTLNAHRAYFEGLRCVRDSIKNKR